MNKITGIVLNNLNWKDNQGKCYALDVAHMKGYSYIDSEEEAQEVC